MLLNSGLIQLALNAGVGTFLALVVIYWYRQDAERRIEDMKNLAQREREDKVLLIQALQENTRVLTELRQILESMERDLRR